MSFPICGKAWKSLKKESSLKIKPLFVLQRAAVLFEKHLMWGSSFGLTEKRIYHIKAVFQWSVYLTLPAAAAFGNFHTNTHVNGIHYSRNRDWDVVQNHFKSRDILQRDFLYFYNLVFFKTTLHGFGIGFYRLHFMISTQHFKDDIDVIVASCSACQKRPYITISSSVLLLVRKLLSSCIEVPFKIM